MSRLLALGLLGLLAALAPAAPAAAATVELVVVGTTPGEPPFKGYPAIPEGDVLELRITADPGDADDLRIDSPRYDVVGVTGTTPLRAGARCRTDAPGSVVCETGATAARGAALRAGRVELGDGDDRLAVASAPARLTVLAGAGSDELAARAEYARGSTWDGGPGADRIVGGGGWTVDYGDRSAPVDVSLDGVANDGEAGEADDAGDDASGLTGGAGADVLRGGAGPLAITGGAGDDLLEARGTATKEVAVEEPSLLGDRETHAELSGGPGADRLLGGPVADGLDGGAGDDDLQGGGGNDVLGGGTGADRLAGGDGDDALVLDAPGDGAPDAAAGGAGRDVAVWGRNVYPRTTRLVVDLADGQGPDGAAGERDALAADVEDVLATVRSFRVTGSDGPNRLTLDGAGTVDGAGGDDELRIEQYTQRDVRMIGGPGEDLIDAGPGSRVDARDGDRDRVDCVDSPRAVRLDAGLDRPRGCAPTARLDTGGETRALRHRPGSLFRSKVYCGDAFHACRVRVLVRLTTGGGPGRALTPVTMRIRPARHRRFAVRLPRDAAPGPQLLRFAVRRASPYRGVPAPWWRTNVPIRVVRPR